MEDIEAEQQNVSAETCIPDWGGEVMNGDMVVGALMELDQ